MSHKNPLGPINKRASSDSEQKNAERREAAHQARVPYKKPPSYKWVYNLILLCILGGLSYWIYLEFVPEDKRLTIIEPSSMTLSVNFEPIAQHLDGNLQVVVVEKVPSAESHLFRQQADLFQKVLSAMQPQSTNQTAAGENWEAVVSAFPDKVYFTRPQAGRYRIGMSELKAEYGSSNVQEMSHNLWASFRDKVESATPQSINQDSIKMHEALSEERLSRAPDSLSYQRQDDYNKARDQADLAWMKLFEQYLSTLKASAENAPNQSSASAVNPEDSLKMWRAFISQESPKLNAWVEENTVSTTPTNLNDIIKIEEAKKTLIYLPLKGHGLYFFPTHLTSFTEQVE